MATLFDLQKHELLVPEQADAGPGDHWGTPPSLLERVRKVLGAIDLDPASNSVGQRHVQATTWYDRETNGLTKRWSGRVWLNPPYSDPAPFVRKLAQSPDVTASMVVVNNAADTRWFHELAEHSDRMLLTLGRIGFLDGHTAVDGARQGQSLFYKGPDPQRFRQVFEPLGLVLPAGAALLDALDELDRRAS